MIWEKLINDLLGRFKKPEKKEWLENLIAIAENRKKEEVALPFRIADVKENGFLVHISGLYGYVAFKYMPWVYADKSYWATIYPRLINKIFFGTIQNVSRAPFKMLVRADIPQFKKYDLEIGEQYHGVIVKKYGFGVLVDIGFHFDWKCGSILGLLHKSEFEDAMTFLSCLEGDTMKVVYLKNDCKKGLFFSLDNEIINWENKIPHELIGQELTVFVSRKTDDEPVRLLVYGKYKAVIDSCKQNHKPAHRKLMNDAIGNLKNGQCIDCKVIACDDVKRVLILNWNIPKNTKPDSIKRIETCINTDTLLKLQALRNKFEKVE